MKRYREIGYDFQVARVELDMLMLLGSDLPDARAAADEARTVFERVAARPYLERLVATLDAARTAGRTAPIVAAESAAELA